MTLDDELLQLQPIRKDKVFDLVGSLGFDTADWIKTAKNPRKIRANPKYCYDWSFIEPAKVAIFNLWYDVMCVEGNAIVYSGNFRKNAEFHRLNGGKRQWVMRALKLDRDAAKAAAERLPIRVIVVAGRRRETEDPNSDSSQVTHRELDHEAWHLRLYDHSTGEFVFARGAGKPTYIDQFDTIEATVERREVTGTISSRSAVVRRAVLERANGQCEYCGDAGFKTRSGQIYLETHHVVSLSEDGADSTDNVIALCPTDHRKAHFAQEAIAIRHQMQAILANRRR